MQILPIELFTIVDTSASIPISLPSTLHDPSSTSSSTSSTTLLPDHTLTMNSNTDINTNTNMNTNTNINSNEDIDMEINTDILRTYKIFDNNSNMNFFEEKQQKTIKDSSIMAASMDVVRSWRNRRCIHIDYVLGCRSESNKIENVRYYTIYCLSIN